VRKTLSSPKCRIERETTSQTPQRRQGVDELSDIFLDDTMMSSSALKVTSSFEKIAFRCPLAFSWSAFISPRPTSPPLGGRTVSPRRNGVRVWLG
jgi:hypothetical protein